MNKKISIFTVIFSGILSTSVFADDVDASKRYAGNGTTTTLTSSNIQGYINKASNVLMPSTNPEDGYIGTSLKSTAQNKSTIQDQDNTSWAATTSGENYAYKSKVNGKIDYSCKSGLITGAAGDKVCSFAGKQASAVVDQSTGYLKAGTAPDNDAVGYVQGPSGEWYYKYWQRVNKEAYDNCETNGVPVDDANYPCECEAGKLGGCWSPLYPMISYMKADGTYPTKSADEAAIGNDNEKAKDFYGKRSGVRNTSSLKNKYYGMNIDSNDPVNKGHAYRMGVKVAAHKEDGVATGTIHSGAKAIVQDRSLPLSDTNRPNLEVKANDATAMLFVRSWTTDSSGKLYPEFNYDTMGSNKVLEGGSDNISLIDKVSSDNRNNVLPCGMFSSDGANPNRNIYADTKGVKCNYKNAIRKSRDDIGNQLYTYYHVALPNGKDSYDYEPIFTHTLNYRACAVCKPLDKNYCRKIVNEYINRGVTGVGALIAALRNNGSSISVGIFEHGNRPTGSGADLTSSNTASTYQYEGTVTCETCLKYLDEILVETDILSKLTDDVPNN